MTEADVRAFLDGYAAAWNAQDVDAIVSFHAVPQIVAEREATHFLEDESEVRAMVAQQLARHEERGVARLEIAELSAYEALPDDAARAEVRWRALDADGAELLNYTVGYTLAPDESEDDGVPRIVATDARELSDAWSA